MNLLSIPGWTIKIDEVSNCVFKISLTDALGRKAEATSHIIEEAIEQASSYAFDIENRIFKKRD